MFQGGHNIENKIYGCYSCHHVTQPAKTMYGYWKKKTQKEPTIKHYCTNIKKVL